VENRFSEFSTELAFLNRRNFLYSLALGAGAFFYARSPFSRLSFTQKTAFENSIDNIVIVMQENRSFDSYFGTFPGADGIPARTKIPKPGGGTVSPSRTTVDLPQDTPHSSEAGFSDINSGRMDGFALTAKSKFQTAMGYWTGNGGSGDLVTYYWQLARSYTLCQRFFASIVAPSFPNHVWMLAVSSLWGGCSGCGKQGQSFPHMTIVDNPSGIVFPVQQNTLDFTIPCINYTLDDHGINWKYYVGKGMAGDKSQTIWHPLPEFSRYKKNPSLFSPHIGDSTVDSNFVPTQVVADIKNNNIAPVTWIIPPAVTSHHPKDASITINYVRSIVRACCKPRAVEENHGPSHLGRLGWFL
jgi:phospholipase C